AARDLLGLGDHPLPGIGDRQALRREAFQQLRATDRGLRLFKRLAVFIAAPAAGPLNLLNLEGCAAVARIRRIIVQLLDLGRLEGLAQGAQEVLDDEPLAFALLRLAGAEVFERGLNAADRRLQVLIARVQ